MAKISYVQKKDAPEKIQAVYDQLQQNFGLVPNVLKTIANHEELFMGFIPFLGIAFGPGGIDSATKELAILTTSRVNGCSYCIAHHTISAKRAGLHKEKIAHALNGKSGALDDREKAVVRYSEELLLLNKVTQESLDGLSRYYDESQIIELTMLNGATNILTKLATTFNIELEF